MTFFWFHLYAVCFFKCLLFKTNASINHWGPYFLCLSPRLCGVWPEEEKCGGAPPAGRLQPVFLSEGERGAAAAAVSRPQEQIQLQPIWTSLREALQRLRVQEGREESADEELLLPLLRLCPPSTTRGGGQSVRHRHGHRSSCCFVWHQHHVWTLDRLGQM